MPGLGHKESTALGKGICLRKSVTGLASGQFFVNVILHTPNKSPYYGFFFFRNKHAKTQNSAVSPPSCKTLLPEETRHGLFVGTCLFFFFCLVSALGFATVTKYLCFTVESA